MAKTTKHTQAYKDATIQNIARDVAVWQIREALEAAFEAGRQTSR